jgi:hypothetical protein
MQYARRISVDLDSLLKVSSTGVSVGTKPSERRIHVDTETLLKVSSTGVAVGNKPQKPLPAGEPAR